MPTTKYSFHADRFGSNLFASLWVKAWGEQYPVQVSPFSSCTHRLLQQLGQQLGLQPGEVLIDLGCGTGGVGLWLAQKQNARLIGVDRCSDAIGIAAKRAPAWDLVHSASFVVGDFCKTGLASAVANAVFSVDAFTATDDIERALSEVRRILRPKGTFVFTTRELISNGRHYEKMKGDWSIGLGQNGFEIRNIQNRSEVSGLWQCLYSQWLKHETELRQELQKETVDALIKEANDGMPKMSDGRPWCLITATRG